MKLNELVKNISALLLIIACQLSAQDVLIELANRHYGVPTSNLGGTLTLDDLGTQDIIDFPEVVSGISVLVSIGHQYTVQTNSEILQGKKHLLWNDMDTEHLLMMSDFLMNFDLVGVGLSANFEFQHEAINESVQSVQIKDPWFVEIDGSQTGENWVRFDDRYQVFLNRNPEFNETDPIYSFKAPRYIAKLDGIYELTGWVGENIIFDETIDYEQFPGHALVDVVFTNGVNIVLGEPLYENKVSDDAGRFILIAKGVNLTIPAGADISFANNVEMKINGTLIVGNIDEAVTRLSCESGVYCSPFDVTQLGKIRMENVNLINTRGVEFSYDYEYGNYAGQPEDKLYLDQVAFENISGYCIRSSIGPNQFDELDLSGCRFVVKNSLISSSIQIETWFGELVFSGNVFSSNSLHIHNSSHIRISDNYFNETWLKMFMFSGNLNEGSLNIYDNIFELPQNNNCFVSLGDFIFEPNPYNVRIHDNTFIGNENSNEIPLLYVTNNEAIISTVTLVIKNNLFASNINGSPVNYNALFVPEFDGLEYSIGYNNFWSFETPYNLQDIGENDLFLDPMFGHNFHLRPNSPCIDAGDPDFDDDGETWETDSDDQDLDGTQLDIGAFYYQISGTAQLSISGNVGDHPTLTWPNETIDDYDFHEVWRYYLGLIEDGIVRAEVSCGSWTDTDFVISRVDIEEDGRRKLRVNRLDQDNTGHDQRVNYQVRAIDSGGHQSQYSNQVHTYRRTPGPINKFTVENTNNLPTVFSLNQNYPNPFNPTTVIRYQLPVISEVQLTVYDLMGRVVRELVSGKINAGTHSIIWNGTDAHGQPVASGMYLYQLKTDNFMKTKKLVLLK